jgi:putative ABC transport system ATP-binding protein
MNDLVSLMSASRVHGTQAILDRVTLHIAPGELVVVMGPSGSGKSTLLNLIAGLDRASAGSVVVAGADLGRLGEAALARHRRRHVGMVFQFFNLIDDLAVADNVALPAQLAGQRLDDARARALDLCRRLRIDDKAERHPSTLSGGERQRVAIARALVNRPELLLADEPTGALDTAAGESVLELLLDLNRAGQTLVLVTHDPRLAERSGGRLVRLLDGRIDAGDSAQRDSRWAAAMPATATHRATAVPADDRR